MEMLEKVERLVEKANVSYEEAKAALDEANGDLLDAMVLLERQGKVKRPEQASFPPSTKSRRTTSTSGTRLRSRNSQRRASAAA